MRSILKYRVYASIEYEKGLIRLFNRIFHNDKQNHDCIDIKQVDDNKRQRLQKEIRMEEIQDPTSYRFLLADLDHQTGSTSQTRPTK